MPPAIFVLVPMAFIVPMVGGLERLAGAGIAIVIILLAARRPDVAILGLVIGLPFQNLVLAQLYEWGLPFNMVRPLASWKEALALGVVAAGAHRFVAERRRADTLDRLALAFVGITAAYALVPGLFSPDGPAGTSARSLAFRGTAGFVLLLLGARHAKFPEGFVDRLADVILRVGVVVAAIAVYEFTFSDSWNRFVVETIQYPSYQFFVLDIVPHNFGDIRFYGHLGGREFVRVGSVLFTPLSLGFYLVLPFAVAVERTVRRGLRTSSGAVLGLIGAALMFTQTRAAIIAAVVAAVVALRPAAGREWSRRIQLIFVLVLGLLVALPAAAATGLSERVTTAASGDEESAVDHIDAFWAGVQTIADHPLGLGLGTSAGTGQRFGATNVVIPENNYLQVGVEIGVVGMMIFVALTLAMLMRLRRSQLAVASLGVSAARGATLGLAVGAFFLHTWTDIAIAFPVWAAAGVAIGAAENRAHQSKPTPETVGRG